MDYLKINKGYSSRLITKLKQDKSYVLCNNSHIRMIDKIFTGDILSITFVDTSYVSENNKLSVPVVYEDEDVICFNKPFNMPSHPSRNHQNDTLANFFMYYIKDKYNMSLQFRPINRLDKDTSGLCIVAKNSLAAKKLSGFLLKEYTAVVCGNFPFNKGEIHAPIIRLDDFHIKRGVNVNGQRAITRYELLCKNDEYSLMKIHLLTGRTHQIRVHFSHLGYPLAGDDMYNGSIKHIKTQALCCNKLEFISPADNKNKQICINIPKYIMDLVEDEY